MLDKRIKFVEKYVDEDYDYDTTTLYFNVPKDLFPEKYPEADYIKLSIEFPSSYPEPNHSTVEFSPVENGDCCDWRDIVLPYEEIEALIQLAFKNEKIKENNIMNIRFYVSGIGYDKNNCVTDYEKDFGDFDTYEEAYDLFVKLQCKDENSFFVNKTDLYQLLIQVEECEETEDNIECVDVKNEWWITNPNYNDYDF